MDEREPEPDEEPPPWSDPVPLDYRPVTPERSGTPMAGQVAMGVATWVAALGGFVALVAAFPRSMDEADIVFLAVVYLIGLAVLMAWIRIRYEWHGFIPGVLLGFGLTCLLPLGYIAILCGHW